MTTENASMKPLKHQGLLRKCTIWLLVYIHNRPALGASDKLPPIEMGRAQIWMMPHGRETQLKVYYVSCLARQPETEENHYKRNQAYKLGPISHGCLHPPPNSPFPAPWGSPWGSLKKQ